MSLILHCDHFPKMWKMEYECKSGGDYSLELCDKCRRTEPRIFLKNEQKIVSTAEQVGHDGRLGHE